MKIKKRVEMFTVIEDYVSQVWCFSHCVFLESRKSIKGLMVCSKAIYTQFVVNRLKPEKPPLKYFKS